MKTFADGIRACIAAVRERSEQHRNDGWDDQADEDDAIANKLERTLLAEATDKPASPELRERARVVADYLAKAPTLSPEEAVANAVAFILHGSEDAAKRVDLLPPIDEADEKQLRALTEAHVATRATRSIAKPVEPVYMCSSPCLLRTGHTGRCFSSYKPVEPPVCKDWCGTVQLLDEAGLVQAMCSPTCRALGRPANPAVQ